MKFVSVAVFMLMTASAFAGDQYNFKVVGFSKDNKIVAIAESVSQDGSCHGVATVSIIDVKANNLLKRVNDRHEGPNDECGSEEKALAGAIAKANLKSFGIDGKIKGQVLLDRLATDLSSYKDTAFAQYTHGTKYSLVLTEKAAQSDQCYEMGEPKMLKLTLNGSDENGKPTTLVMQDDSSLPKSRGCALAYGVSKVIKSGDALVVIVNKSSPGFEGPDSSFMAITTEIKLD